MLNVGFSSAGNLSVLFGKGDNKGNTKMTEDARSDNSSGKFKKLTLKIKGEREKENLAG